MTMEIFIVCDGVKPAQFPQHSIHSSWSNCVFSKKKDAIEYLRRYLGIFNGCLPRNDEDVEVEKAYDYSGFGDTVIIRVREITL